jgi:hypothetical protein
MARTKEWLSRIELILKVLESDTSRERYLRADIVELFGVSANTALQILSFAGAPRPPVGEDKVVSREGLLAYLKYHPECAAAIQEVERRRKLAKVLRDAEEDLAGRRIKLRVTADSEGTRFVEIPNVSVRPGLIQVVFTPGDPLAAIDALWRFAKAVINEWDAFERMSGGSNGAQAALPFEGKGAA